MNRGARRANIFRDNATRALFLRLVSELPARFGVRVHAYVIMPNHFHLLLESMRGNISAAMQWLSGRFVQRLNGLNAWDGPIFKGRFHNRLVLDDRYWRHLLAYLHLNPVRARLVVDAADYRFSSHRAYLGFEAAPEWLFTQKMMRVHEGLDGYMAYMDLFVDNGRRPDDPFDGQPMWSGPHSVLVPTQTPKYVVDQRILRKRTLSEVASTLDCTIECLMTAGRGPVPNIQRWVAIWWLIRCGNQTRKEVANLMGIDSSGVSKIESNLQRRRQTDPMVMEWMERLLQLEED